MHPDSSYANQGSSRDMTVRRNSLHNLAFYLDEATKFKWSKGNRFLPYETFQFFLSLTLLKSIPTLGREGLQLDYSLERKKVEDCHVADNSNVIVSLKVVINTSWNQWNKIHL